MKQQVLHWRNGHWLPLYYDNFFVNCLNRHVRKVAGYKNKHTEEKKILNEMASGAVVRVNGLTFKFRKEKTVSEQHRGKP